MISSCEYAQAMHDTPGGIEQQINTDWKVAVARDSLRRFVFTEDVDVRTEQCKVDHVSIVWLWWERPSRPRSS